MNNNLECIENFESIFEDVKLVTNSFVRLKILSSLFKNSQNMKDMTDLTKLSYSSVSSNIHDLELKGWVYREHNRYYLTNATAVRIGDIMEFHEIVNLIDELFNILDGHMVDMIPYESILELNMLNNAVLMDSKGIDAYKVYGYIENSLKEAETLEGILPIYYEPFFMALNDLISNKKAVEVYVPQNLLEDFENKSGIEIFNPLSESDSFLLIITDKVMIMGFFMDNGFFDQNRIITSYDADAMKWACGLFDNIKKLNK